VATSPQNALRIWDLLNHVDVTELAKQVRAPTLVLHCSGDRIAPIEEGRLMASTIPGAKFVELPGNNHTPTAGTPAFDQFVEETAAFLAEHNH
jgi:pimeloyl-ACP methyl ester carboxylesterase